MLFVVNSNKLLSTSLKIVYFGCFQEVIALGSLNVFGLEVSNRIFLHRLVCWELVVREGQVNDNIYFSYSC